MADHDYDETTANEATGYSGFGGHLLTTDGAAAAITSRGGDRSLPLDVLASLGIEDAEQLIAAAAIPQVREELKSVLGVKDKDIEHVLQRLEQTLTPERTALVKTPAPKDL